MLDCFKFLTPSIGAFDLNSASGGGDLDAFCPGSMSNCPPFPGTWGVVFQLTGALGLSKSIYIVLHVHVSVLSF